MYTKYNYTYMCKSTINFICIHVSIPGLLNEYHWRHAK